MTTFLKHIKNHINNSILEYKNAARINEYDNNGNLLITYQIKCNIHFDILLFLNDFEIVTKNNVNLTNIAHLIEFKYRYVCYYLSLKDLSCHPDLFIFHNDHICQLISTRAASLSNAIDFYLAERYISINFNETSIKQLFKDIKNKFLILEKIIQSNILLYKL